MWQYLMVLLQTSFSGSLKVSLPTITSSQQVAPVLFVLSLQYIDTNNFGKFPKLSQIFEVILKLYLIFREFFHIPLNFVFGLKISLLGVSTSGYPVEFS